MSAAQNKFLADLQRATAGITYTPSQVTGLTNLARAGGASAGSLATIASAPRRSTGPTEVNPSDATNTSLRQSRPYSTTLPPLSPDMLAAIERRRQQANRQLQEAEATVQDLSARAELENIGRVMGIEEDIARQRRAGVSGLAARGVARSPMFANPFRREMARTQQEQVGNSQRQLTDTLDQLNVALNAARQRREAELAAIAFDEAAARSNVNRLLGLE